MANRRNRIIYASQSVFAEGRILYRVQTLGSSTTFNTTDIFELGQLNLTDVVDDSPEVAVTIDGFDYGSIYTMATLAKVPTTILNHNIRQSDGSTFDGVVGAFGDVSTGDLTDVAYSGLDAASGTGEANIVIKEEAESSDALAYLHGVQLIDFGRECGVSKGVDIWAPVQTECALGSTRAEIEFTKFLQDVFVNSVEFNYQSDDNSAENYAGETEKKVWFLNDARFLSWEEWHVGSLTGQIGASAMAAKSKLYLSLDASSNGAVATLEDGNIGFLKKTEVGRPAVLFTFSVGGGLTVGESKAVPVFDKAECVPSNAVEFFLYDSTDNSLEYYVNGIADTLDEVLPAGRSAFISGDKIYVLYVANQYAEEDTAARPVNADSSVVVGKYFAPISTDDVEDVGAVRQGQVEAYLVDPDLIFKQALTNATVTASGITFNSGVSSQVDLTKYVGLSLSVVDGPGKGGPAREITAAANNIVGDENQGSLTLGGSDWATIRLVEDTSETSTISGAYVTNLCGIDADYIGSDITIEVSSTPETRTVSGVDLVNNFIGISGASGAADDGSDILVSVEPTTASTILIGDYRLALRLQNVTFSADLTREMQKELGHLDPYARTLTLPIEFTVTIDTTAADLETYATFAGKLNKYENATLTDLDITDLFAKDNLAVVVMVYQQTDKEAGGSGIDRKVFSPDMFGDEYFVNGIRDVYSSTEGDLREYPLKTVIAQNLRITDEEFSHAQGDNATQTYGFRGTNELSALRGHVGVDLVTKVIESRGQ